MTRQWSSKASSKQWSSLRVPRSATKMPAKPRTYRKAPSTARTPASRSSYSARSPPKAATQSRTRWSPASSKGRTTQRSGILERIWVQRIRERLSKWSTNPMLCTDSEICQTTSISSAIPPTESPPPTTSAPTSPTSSSPSDLLEPDVPPLTEPLSCTDESCPTASP